MAPTRIRKSRLGLPVARAIMCTTHLPMLRGLIKSKSGSAKLPVRLFVVARLISVADLKAQIERYTQHWNEHPQPFVWTATTESILAKIERLCKVIYGTQH